jgi:hypothetical protein
MVLMNEVDEEGVLIGCGSRRSWSRPFDLDWPGAQISMRWTEKSGLSQSNGVLAQSILFGLGSTSRWTEKPSPVHLIMKYNSVVGNLAKVRRSRAPGGTSVRY